MLRLTIRNCCATKWKKKKKQQWKRDGKKPIENKTQAETKR